MPLYGLNAGEAKPIVSNPYARDRRVSVNPLLVPVENLTHWRALKAKGARPLRPGDNLTQPEAIAAHPYALRKSVLGNPLLIPVENITQWKAVKAKGTPPLRPVEKNLIQQKTVKAKGKSPRPVEDPTRWKAANPLRIPVESLAEWKAVKAKGAPPLKSQKENFVQNQVPRVPFRSEPSVEELSFNRGKQSNQETARRSLSRRPNGMPRIGTVETYWNHTVPAKYSGSISYYK
ncbi:hypothetical protein CJ030_MR6G006537 [Morella rubra]|uniref:Uncharacterized protein n=1 Tax=Morella rubra TaxID=262757 RepID=A0A6A1V730_9ROSI|nr:hypothetical protein CJ030_MR6G006537 [Morella rubra]